MTDVLMKGQIGEIAARMVKDRIKATFEGRGVSVTDDQCQSAADQMVRDVLHIAMAGNPRDWCLSCGTVSGNGECDCTNASEVIECNRNARHYQSELHSELDKLVAENARLRDALEPFAIFGQKLGLRDPECFDMLIYEMAGDGTKLVGDDFRRAHKAVEGPR